MLMTTFTSTSTAPYDQCVYALVMKGGYVKGVWEDYEHVRDLWMIEQGRNMDSIEVITRKELESKTSGEGFK